MPNRGKLVIGSLLAAGLLAAGFAWWFTYHQGQRILQLWGPEAALRIRTAPECELLVLERATGSGPADLTIREDGWRILNRANLAQAPGFVHARQALIEDGSYRWQEKITTADSANWQHALRFRDARGETLLVFDLSRGWVLDVHQNRTADIQVIAPGLMTYFSEQLGITDASNEVPAAEDHHEEHEEHEGEESENKTLDATLQFGVVEVDQPSNLHASQFHVT